MPERVASAGWPSSVPAEIAAQVGQGDCRACLAAEQAKRVPDAQGPGIDFGFDVVHWQRRIGEN